MFEGFLLYYILLSLLARDVHAYVATPSLRLKCTWTVAAKKWMTKASTTKHALQQTSYNTHTHTQRERERERARARERERERELCEYLDQFLWASLKTPRIENTMVSTFFIIRIYHTKVTSEPRCISRTDGQNH